MKIDNFFTVIITFCFIVVGAISSYCTYQIFVPSLEQRLKEEYEAKLIQIEEELLNKQEPVDKIEAFTLAEKNNNPLNIKANNWLGQTGTDEFGHAQFITNEHGIRAAAIVLINYAYKHKIDNIYDIIHRFCTGNQKEYIEFLCKKLNLKPHEKFDILQRLPELLKAMAKFESGKNWEYTYFIPYSIVANVYQKGVNK